MQDRIGAVGGWLQPYPARGRMKQGQDLGCATADVFVRLDGGLAVRLPRHTGMRHGLEGASFVLAPDRQPKLRAERIGWIQAVVATQSLLAARSNWSSASAGVLQSSVFRGLALRAIAAPVVPWGRCLECGGGVISGLSTEP